MQVVSNSARFSLCDPEDQQRRLALRYIRNAALMLSQLGEADRRLSWLLTDCAGMLSDVEEPLPTDSDAWDRAVATSLAPLTGAPLTGA